MVQPSKLLRPVTKLYRSRQVPSTVDSMRTPSMNLEARGLVPSEGIDDSACPFEAKEDDAAVKATKKGRRGRFGGLSFRKSSSKGGRAEEVSFDASWLPVASVRRLSRTQQCPVCASRDWRKVSERWKGVNYVNENTDVDGR